MPQDVHGQDGSQARPPAVAEPPRAADPLLGRVRAADTGAVVRQWGEVLEGVLEDGRERTAGALQRPLARRPRWPWAVAAAVAGAVGGGVVALAVRRLVGEDAPQAQEPEQLLAVVDQAPRAAT